MNKISKATENSPSPNLVGSPKIEIQSSAYVEKRIQEYFNLKEK